MFTVASALDARLRTARRIYSRARDYGAPSPEPRIVERRWIRCDSLRFALAGLLPATHMPAALAQTPKFISNFRDWTVYEVVDPAKICYIASEPSKQDGTNKRGNLPCWWRACRASRRASR
ncbi:MAG: hypothetical protein U1E17_04915 [Geminicoccaceae bacterium]